ncbi:ATP-binding cassette domain-containing protein [Rubritalea marina]|uniref:ATP-binding cassette domain-containing protein n=1 Tax=Rubritalea marina TaxID=361055 RepID=UPI00037574E2|nr:ATP-binding cassette domain-containing protein [Rubritalea marina]
MLELREVTTHFPVRKGLLFQRQVDSIKAVSDVSLSIQQGEILGLVGESGCGKSTLSRTIMQLIPATSGSISLEGLELTDLNKKEVRAHRLDFQMIFQDPYASLNPRMTVFTTLAEAITQRHPKLKQDKATLNQKVDALMQRCGLDPAFTHKYPHEFSGGQRQRIAIARALAPEPKLIIADEPVSALDVSIQSQILNLMLDLRRDLNLTMIFITHDLGVVRYLADNIAVMHKGRIVEYGPAEEIFKDPQQDYTKTLLAAIPQLDRISPSGI